MAMHNRGVDVFQTSSRRWPGAREWRGWLTGATAAGAGALLLMLAPQLQVGVFATGAARLAAGFMGVGVESGQVGPMLMLSDRTVAVTAACSGADFFLIVAALLGWRLQRRDRTFVCGVMTSLVV